MKYKQDVSNSINLRSTSRNYFVLLFAQSQYMAMLMHVVYYGDAFSSYLPYITFGPLQFHKGSLTGIVHKLLSTHFSHP